MRDEGGIKAIMAACEKFRSRADLHVANYGHGIEERLTGKHETAPYKYPRLVYFVDELPKTVSGKIRRTELRDQLREGGA